MRNFSEVGRGYLRNSMLAGIGVTLGAAACVVAFSGKKHEPCARSLTAAETELTSAYQNSHHMGSIATGNSAVLEGLIYDLDNRSVAEVCRTSTEVYTVTVATEK